MEPTSAPWWLAGSAVALWIVRETWGAVLARRKNRTETDANVDLVRGLAERVKALEESQTRLTTRLDEEIKLRMQAQEDAHRLRLRVLTLEAAMRQIGAVIPPQDPITG